MAYHVKICDGSNSTTGLKYKKVILKKNDAYELSTLINWKMMTLTYNNKIIVWKRKENNCGDASHVSSQE